MSIRDFTCANMSDLATDYRRRYNAATARDPGAALYLTKPEDIFGDAENYNVNGAAPAANADSKALDDYIKNRGAKKP